MIWFALVALPAVALRSVFYACASAIFAFHFCYSLIWNMKIEYPFWKLVFEGFKSTKIQKAAVIAAFVSPVKGEFVLKTSVLIVEFKPSPNLKHYHLAERTGFEPVEPVAQLGSLANYWFQPLTQTSMRLKLTGALFLNCECKGIGFYCNHQMFSVLFYDKMRILLHFCSWVRLTRSFCDVFYSWMRL